MAAPSYICTPFKLDGSINDRHQPCIDSTFLNSMGIQCVLVSLLYFQLAVKGMAVVNRAINAKPKCICFFSLPPSACGVVTFQ